MAAVHEPEIYEHNIRALQGVVQEDLKATDIGVRLGAKWLPPKDIE